MDDIAEKHAALDKMFDERIRSVTRMQYAFRATTTAMFFAGYYYAHKLPIAGRGAAFGAFVATSWVLKKCLETHAFGQTYKTIMSVPKEHVDLEFRTRIAEEIDSDINFKIWKRIDPWFSES